MELEQFVSHFPSHISIRLLESLLVRAINTMCPRVFPSLFPPFSISRPSPLLLFLRETKGSSNEISDPFFNERCALTRVSRIKAARICTLFFRNLFLVFHFSLFETLCDPASRDVYWMQESRILPSTFTAQVLAYSVLAWISTAYLFVNRAASVLFIELYSCHS